MRNNYLLQLLTKHEAGTLSKEEAAELRQWYTQLSQPLAEAAAQPGEPTAEQLLRNFMARRAAASLPRRRAQRPWRTQLAVAASLLLLLGGWWLLRGSGGHLATPAGQALAVTVESRAVRYMRLPDSTVVILKPGSRLRYHSAGGAHDARLVSLQGEAYFAVHHDKQRPFSIQTGDVKTTVLGTVFTVKAWGKAPDVIVSVLSGRVRVENAHHQLALLTHNQQLVYRSGQPAASQPVNAEKAADWLRQDLQFEQQTLGQIAITLSQRFGVPISFRHPQAAACWVSAYFLGTESLSTILATVCATTSATYQIDAKTGAVWIDGPGC